MTIEQKLYEYIKKNPHRSFYQIEKFFSQNNVEWEGDIAIFVPGMGETVMWAGWSQKAIDIFGAVRKMPGVIVQSCSYLTYLIDGKALTFPLATKNFQYKKLHWLPMTVFVKEEAA